MLLNFIILTVCAFITIVAVRLLVIYGINILSTALRFSVKTKGQIIGYATSIPELVVVVSSAFAGVFDAGFWNIASSNIINFVLFLLAVLIYKQHSDLLKPKFIDELIFGVLSMAIPLGLYTLHVELTGGVAGLLLLVFLIYKVVDRALNREEQKYRQSHAVQGNVTKGLAALILGIVIVVFTGRYLGISAHALVYEIGTPTWLIGWILGFITSLPELTSFFEIYRLEKKNGRLHLLDDTQEALDALVSSNMSNLGVILPIGIIVYSLIRFL